MQIQLNPSFSTNNSNYKNKSNTSFKATPEAALVAIQNTKLYTPAIRKILTQTVTAFMESRTAITIETKMVGLRYHLVGTQSLSPKIREIKTEMARGKSIAFFDDVLKTREIGTDLSFRSMLHNILREQQVPNNLTLEIVEETE